MISLTTPRPRDRHPPPLVGVPALIVMLLQMKYIGSIFALLVLNTTLCFSQEVQNTSEQTKTDAQWIELLDTAVKIGLGSAVTAIGAIVLARINAGKERETEFLKRKRNRIEEISRDFEKAHATVIDVNATNGTILLAIEGNREISEKWIVQLHVLEEEFKKVFETVHILEGSLSLIECDQARKEIENYRNGLTCFSQNIAWIPSDEFKGKVLETDAAVKRMTTARTNFYQFIRTEYKKA